MDEINKPNDNGYAYLRQLPIDKLLELLTVAPVLSTFPEDEAYVEALEEAIIEKEKENPTGFFPDVDQQWEQFLTYYQPDANEAALEPGQTEHAVSAQTPQRSPQCPPNVPQKRVVQFSRVWRTALVAAVSVALAFGIMLTAQAAGIDVFGTMARWSKDVFSFGRIPPNSEVSENPRQATGDHGNREFSSLQEAFDVYGLMEVHEPTWLPEGYILGRAIALHMDDPFLQTFSAFYSDGEGQISINITSYEGEPITQVQKTDDPVELVEKNGVMFYHIENSVGRTIAWYSDHYEYYLSSDEEDNVLWKIADSMFEQEGF